jgi:hypothetical protein
VGLTKAQKGIIRRLATDDTVPFIKRLKAIDTEAREVGAWFTRRDAGRTYQEIPIRSHKFLRSALRKLRASCPESMRATIDSRLACLAGVQLDDRGGRNRVWRPANPLAKPPEPVQAPVEPMSDIQRAIADAVRRLNSGESQ